MYRNIKLHDQSSFPEIARTPGPNPAASERAAKAVADFKTKLAGDPAFANVKLTSFGKDHYDSIAPAGSADMILTFRNVHNWHMNGFAPQAFQVRRAAVAHAGLEPPDELVQHFAGRATVGHDAFNAFRHILAGAALKVAVRTALAHRAQ